MRDIFPSFYKFDKDEAKDIWNNATFVFDANVLLNAYRYPESVAKELLDTIESYKDRVWIPHNIALEFQRNRLRVISEQRRRGDEVRKLIESGLGNLTKEIQKLNLEERHSHLDPNAVLEVFHQAKMSALELVSASDNKQMDVTDHDAIRTRIDKIFSGKIGSPPKEQSELEELYAVAEERFKRLQPPGYADANKANSEDGRFFYTGIEFQSAYGDFLNWHQILEHFSKTESPSIIFVTDDVKADWWWRVRSMGPKTIGVRRELIEEFQSRTGSNRLLAYTSDSFLKFAQENEGAKISTDSIELVKDVALQRFAEKNRSEASKAISSLMGLQKVVQAEHAIFEYLKIRYPDSNVRFAKHGPMDFHIEDIETGNFIGVEVKSISERTTYSDVFRVLDDIKRVVSQHEYSSAQVFFVSDLLDQSLENVVSERINGEFAEQIEVNFAHLDEDGHLRSIVRLI